MYKQVIVIRSDLKMSKGKIAIQVSHASVSALEKAGKAKMNVWKKEGQKKIALKVKTLEEMLVIKKKAEDSGLPVALITDAGLTELEPGTITALGIGPDDEKKIDKITGSLPLLR